MHGLTLVNLPLIQVFTIGLKENIKYFDLKIPGMSLYKTWLDFKIHD